MIEQNKQEHTPTTRFRDLIENVGDLYSEKMLDTDVDVASGDTILTRPMIENYSEAEIDAALEQWSSYAISLDEQDPVERAYLERARYKINDLQLIRALYQQVTGEVDQSERIRQLEALMYGHYRPELYRAALKQKIQLLEALEIEDPDINTARAQVIDELSLFLERGEGGSEVLEAPAEGTLEAVNGWLEDQFGDSLEVLDDFKNETLDANDLKLFFDQAIASTPALRDSGWVVSIIERKKLQLSVFVRSKEIVIPSQRTVSKKDARKLLVHEVMGHALKSAIAESLGNEVGTNGTATYSSFEESFEIALEQCLEMAYDPERGLNHYIAAGLAITDNQPSDRISYLFNSIKQLEKSVGGLSPEEVEDASKLASKQLGRTFAGMTDVDAGIVHRKDINYLHGLNGAWRILNHLVQSGQLDEGMRWLLSAKFNPFDETDRALTNSYTPMPSSLVDFFGNEEKETSR